MSTDISMPSTNALPATPAAEYVRMSTEQQQFSIAYQQAAIRLYAAQRGMTVVRTYADEGRSGLTLRERPAMKQLLSDVESGATDFEIILVYDVSRWGRYQDTDEGAFHEFRCRKAGKRVEYCAEQFSSDISPFNAIVKAIKRAMAAEYSRELAVRTYSGHVRAAARGFLQGGIPGYGLRRMLVDENGQLKGIMPPGTYKSIRTDRVVLVPGPWEEIETVRRIFGLFVNEHVFKSRIARILNAEKIPFTDGRRWSEESIRNLLANERYVGTLIYGKTSSLLRLGGGDGRIKADPKTSVRVPAGYEPIVPPDVFAAANAPKENPGSWYRDDGLLMHLRKLLREHGYLGPGLVARSKGVPCLQTYINRFGTIAAAFARIGYVPERDKFRVPHYHVSRKLVLSIAKRLEISAAAVGMSTAWNWSRRTITFEDGTSIRITVARYLRTRRNRIDRWVMETTTRLPSPHFTLVIKLAPEHEKPIGYYCMPSHVFSGRLNFFDGRNAFEAYRCDTAKKAISTAIKSVHKNHKGIPSHEGVPLDVVKALSGGMHPVKVWRKHRGLTIQVLADRSGISDCHLSRIETGKRQLTSAVKKRLAKSLKISAEDISAWPPVNEKRQSSAGASSPAGPVENGSAIRY